MPIFEYRCNGCGHEFDDIETIANRDRPRQCPACGGSDVKRMISVFAARVAGCASGAACDPGGST